MPLTGPLFDRCLSVSWMLAVGGLPLAGLKPVCAATNGPPVTKVAQVAQLASSQPVTSQEIRLVGTVWWAGSGDNRFVLGDESGSAELQMDLLGHRLAPGQNVRIEGHGTIARIGAGFRLGPIGAVVDNDGEHGMIEKSGAVYLSEGLNPVRLEWFNRLEAHGLQVEYEGPALQRQSLPSSRLFRPSADSEATAPGLDYRAYTGSWQALPEFDELTPIQNGSVGNFDLSVCPAQENVALVFEGQLRVLRSGLHVFHLRSDDGSRIFVGEPTLSLEVIGEGSLPKPRLFALGQSWQQSSAGDWGSVEGRVTAWHQTDERTVFELHAGPAGARVELGNGLAKPTVPPLHRRVRVTGFCQPVATVEGDAVLGSVLVPNTSGIKLLGADVGDDATSPPAGDAARQLLLTNAVAVHRLKREEAERGLPVRITGVVTSVLPEHQAFTLQDATRGLYVEDRSAFRSRPPQVGEHLQVEGITDPSLFAPIVSARRVETIGMGQMPEPVKPTWDQLMTGSLDAQFVELEGFITAVQSNRVSLMTRAGVVGVELHLAGKDTPGLDSYENALVRIRGCLFASWDYVTHQVSMGEVRVYDANLVVEQPAPIDLFSSPSKTASELLLFDPQAGAFQRIRIRGQIIHVRGTEHFMTDGVHGVRFVPMKPQEFQRGDEVEVVGFPELFGGGAPVLREAMARKIGRRALPKARALSAEDLVDAAHDSTLVQVQGQLAGVRRATDEEILEIQSGVRRFIARLPLNENSPNPLPVGSLLELHGVYAGHGGRLSVHGELAGFELLLDSRSDVHVLARPPWWTLTRLLVIVGLLGSVLAATMLWVTQLRRQVEQRSAELSVQIKEKERVEHERAIEQERTRIAQDLHDELGSGITEISMLAARAKSDSLPAERRGHYLDEAWGKAREMVTALDEIVWAMNPRHDSLSSLVSYFSVYADRFLGLAGVEWRLEGNPVSPDPMMASRHRHQLFLVFKEALNNVVRHARATQVRVHYRVRDDVLSLDISDNGRGLPKDNPPERRSGIGNMRGRLEKMGGQLDLESHPHQGTTLHLRLPLTQRT